MERATKAVDDYCWKYEAHTPINPSGIARAALTSTSEPTPEMIKAGVDVLVDMVTAQGEFSATTEDVIRKIFAEMHDAMMETK